MQNYFGGLFISLAKSKNLFLSPLHGQYLQGCFDSVVKLSHCSLLSQQHLMFLDHLFLPAFSCSFSFWHSERKITISLKVTSRLVQEQMQIKNEINSLVNRIRKMVSFELGRKMERDVFMSCHKCGTKKKF